MSQQGTAKQGAGRGRGRKKPQYFSLGGKFEAEKPYRLAIFEIANETFNTRHNKFAAQFTKLQQNVANYLQCLAAAEGYLVAEMVQTKVIELPAPVDANLLDRDDLNLIRNKEIKSVAKRRQKLDKSLKMGFATVYDQCSREV
jgi:hypothetical protein